MAKTDWTLLDEVKPADMNSIGEEINQLRTDVDNIEIPQASLTQAGIVQLSNAANAVDEDKAATPKAVKTAYDAAATAQNNVDNHAALTTAHGATSAATANRIIVRDSAGRAKIAAPSASDDIARKDTVDNVVGNLSNLLTSAKGNTVAAINELFTSASNGKTQIAAAITGKGVPASGSDTFAQLANKIGQIQTEHIMGAGDILLYIALQNEAPAANSTSYTKMHSTRIARAGTYRISFSVKTSYGSAAAYGRIYKNGVPIGLERYTFSVTPVSFVEDITFAAGDIVELWGKISLSGQAAQFSDFKIMGDAQPYVVDIEI